MANDKYCGYVVNNRGEKKPNQQSNPPTLDIWLAVRNGMINYGTCNIIAHKLLSDN